MEGPRIGRYFSRKGEEHHHFDSPGGAVTIREGCTPEIVLSTTGQNDGAFRNPGALLGEPPELRLNQETSMPNQNPTTGQSPPTDRQPPPLPGDDKSEQDVRDMSPQSPGRNQPIDEDVEKPDNVEIGDPIPEDDRTIKARGEGETGEDEDLPADDGDIEGRH